MQTSLGSNRRSVPPCLLLCGSGGGAVAADSHRMSPCQRARIERSAVPAKPSRSPELQFHNAERYTTGENCRMHRSQCWSSREALGIWYEKSSQRKEKQTRESRHAPFLRSTRYIECKVSRSLLPKFLLRMVSSRS